MLTHKITTTLSPLKLLRAGEQGVIFKLKNSGEHINQKLRAMGLTLGSIITLEQKFPRYIIRVGNNRVALSEDILQVVHVRLLDR